jgi:hypothetical protein
MLINQINTIGGKFKQGFAEGRKKQVFYLFILILFSKNLLFLYTVRVLFVH